MLSVVINTDQKHLGEERVPWLALSGHSPPSRELKQNLRRNTACWLTSGPCSVSLLIQLEPTHLRMVPASVAWALSHQDHQS